VAESAPTAAVRRRLATFQPPGGAPDWIPPRLLQQIAALPTARRAWRKGPGGPAQRALLIRAGAGGRRDYGPASQTARALATLLRREPLLWDIALQATFQHHDVGDGELLALARDPVGYLEARPSCPGEYVVTAAWALGAADRDELALLAEEAARRLDVAHEDEDAERHRIQGLEDLVQTLEKDLKDRDKRLHSALQEAQQLAASLEQLQRAERRVGDVDEELAAARAKGAEDARTIAALRGELASARTDQERLAEAESAAAERDALRADVEQLRAERDREQALRVEAQEEADRVAERMLARARRSPEEILPLGSPAELLPALAPVLGRAAALAAERIAGGRALDADPQLLRLAALFSELGGPAPEAPAEPVAAVPAPRTRARRAAGAGGAFRVRALGGAEEIGGSAFLVQTESGHSMLLDAGQRVRGEYGDPSAQPFHFRVPTDTLDAVLVGHAHIDHVGSLPTILGASEAATDREVPVWMTEPTRRLAEIMLLDSARIQRAREERLSVRALGDTDYAPESMRAAYTRRDAEEVIARVRVAERGGKFRIDDTGLLVRYLPVPHVLGSCAIHVTEEETGATLLYTGDLGPVSDPQATLPQWGFDELEPADVVIMESTYGAADGAEGEGRRALHGRERALQLLIDCAGKTVGRRGFLLLPTFSLGRAQELVKLIGTHRGREMPDGPLYVAGMGNKIMDVYDQYGQARNGGWTTVGSFPSVRDPTAWLHPEGTFDDAAAEILHGEEPGYLIASPALVSGGWSRAFLRGIVGDRDSGVVFTGYMPRGAGGISRIDRLRTGDRLRLDGEDHRIECLWERLSLSAHAPTRDLHAFAERMTRGRERTAFCVVHGDPASQRELATWITQSLGDRGATAHSLQRQMPWTPPA
jgi:Cft2 family RNA processing exonuclease